MPRLINPNTFWEKFTFTIIVLLPRFCSGRLPIIGGNSFIDEHICMYVHILIVFRQKLSLFFSFFLKAGKAEGTKCWLSKKIGTLLAYVVTLHSYTFSLPFSLTVSHSLQYKNEIDAVKRGRRKEDSISIKVGRQKKINFCGILL